MHIYGADPPLIMRGSRVSWDNDKDLNCQFNPLYLIVYVVCKGWAVNRAHDKKEGGLVILATLD